MITKQDVAYVAKLAHLTISEAEQENFVSQLDTILDYINQLDELDDILEEKNIKPTMHAWDSEETYLREDVVVASMDRDDILKESARSLEGSFIVPKVIDIS